MLHKNYLYNIVEECRDSYMVWIYIYFRGDQNNDIMR